MKCISPLYVKKNVVPCGKCNYCLQLRKLDWTFRLTNEMRYSTTSYFVTLTLRYAPQYGVWKRHLQLFIKRLRKSSSSKIVYYAVAEYGARTFRPHYHAIIFNADADRIRSAWKLGHIHIGSVSAGSLSYVANYSLKGSRCPSGMRRPFALMSRRPAIGSKYLVTHLDWHRAGCPIESDQDVSLFRPFTLVNGVRGHLPRFYRDRLFTDKERERMFPLVVAQVDEAYHKRINELKLLSPNPFNQIIEEDRWKHDHLTQTITNNETI